MKRLTFLKKRTPPMIPDKIILSDDPQDVAEAIHNVASRIALKEAYVKSWSTMALPDVLEIELSLIVPWKK